MQIQELVRDTREVLKDFKFPLRREDILDQVEEQGADSEVRSFLQKMPEGKYDNIEDLLSKLPLSPLETEIEE